MTSETDLSTADLAQPGGTRQPDRADEEQGRGGRSYETAGNRVADEVAGGPAGADTGSAGSTRDDALRADAPYPGRAGDRDMAGEGMTDRGMTDRGMTDRGMTDRGMADRGMTSGDMTDRDMTGGDMADQGMTDRTMTDPGMTDRTMTDPGMGGREMDDRGMSHRDMGDRDMGDRDMTGPGMAGEGLVGQGTSDRGTGSGGDVALLDPTDAESFRQRWSDTQARFVDDPREAVQTADGLVAELMQTLASSFDQHKGELESHWRSGGDPDTEDLRQALQRYRSFFDRLLSA